MITIEEASAGRLSAPRSCIISPGAALLDQGLRIRPMTLPDRFIDHAGPAVQLAEAGLDSRAIVAAALSALSVADAVREVSSGWRTGA